MASKKKADIKAVSDSSNGKRPSSKRLQRGEHVIPDVINKSDLSKYCVDVMETFGLEAPALLNDYACSVEDAFIKLVDERADLITAIKAMKQELDELHKFKADIYEKFGLNSKHKAESIQ